MNSILLVTREGFHILSFGLCHRFASNAPKRFPAKAKNVAVSRTPSKTNRFRRPMNYYHPLASKIRDETELRRHPRYTTLFREYEFEPWSVFRSFPHFAQYFPRSDGSVTRTECAADHDAVYYLSQDYLPPWIPRGRIPLPSVAERFVPAYKTFWRHSADVKPTDIAHVLAQVAHWYSVGIKPCNLISEALQLLSTQSCRNSVVLCMLYKGGCTGYGIPSDEQALDHVENFLAREGQTLRMTEITTICDGFFHSDRGFHRPEVAKVVATRYYQLLQSGHYPWTDSSHIMFKQLKMTEYQDVEEMRLLQPALDAAGFFEFCAQRKFNGLHDVHFLMQYLVARSYHDDQLLRRCVSIFETSVHNEEFRLWRSKDVSRTLLHFALVDFQLNEDVMARCTDFFRASCLPVMKENFGISLLQFLDAASLFDVYPLDIIDAFFASDLVRVEGRDLPGMKGEASMGNPWEELLRYDEILGVMRPDYTGARLSAKGKNVALRYIKPPTASKELHSFASSLNDAICKKFGKKGQYVAIENVFRTKTIPDVIVHFGKNGRPLFLKSKVKPTRKIAIQLLSQKHYLMDGEGCVKWAVKPVIRRFFKCLSLLGYEVVVVGNQRRDGHTDVDTLAAEIVNEIMKNTSG